MKNHLKLVLIFTMLAVLAGVVNGQNLRKEDLNSQGEDSALLQNNNTRSSGGLKNRNKMQQEDAAQDLFEESLHKKKENKLNSFQHMLTSQEVNQFVRDVNILCPDIDFKREDVNSITSFDFDILNKMITLVKDKELLLNQNVDFTCKAQKEFSMQLNSLHNIQQSFRYYSMRVKDKTCFIDGDSLLNDGNIYFRSALNSYLGPSFKIISKEEFNLLLKGEEEEFCKNNDKTYFASCIFIKLFARLGCIVVALEGMKNQAGRVIRTAERVSRYYSSFAGAIRGFVDGRINGAERLPEV